VNVPVESSGGIEWKPIMSRIAKKPLSLVSGAKVSVAGQTVNVEGKLGKLTFVVHPSVTVKVDGANIVVDRKNDEKLSRALHGTTWRIINNMMIGVTAGYKKILEMRGVGYKAELKGKKLVLNVGFANQVTKDVPPGLTVVVEPGAGDITNKISVSGADKQVVGEFAANVRKVRKPEPYKGKGIRYEGESVKIKPGKAFAGAGAK
jgi:large subunit ribosomal protein L6